MNGPAKLFGLGGPLLMRMGQPESCSSWGIYHSCGPRSRRVGIDVGHRASPSQNRSVQDSSVPYCMYYLRTHSAGIFEPQLSGESIGRPVIASSIVIARGQHGHLLLRIYGGSAGRVNGKK